VLLHIYKDAKWLMQLDCTGDQFSHSVPTTGDSSDHKDEFDFAAFTADFHVGAKGSIVESLFSKVYELFNVLDTLRTGHEKSYSPSKWCYIPNLYPPSSAPPLPIHLLPP